MGKIGCGNERQIRAEEVRLCWAWNPDTICHQGTSLFVCGIFPHIVVLNMMKNITGNDAIALQLDREWCKDIPVCTMQGPPGGFSHDRVENLGTCMLVTQWWGGEQ